jgi:hypothetical protein
VLAEELLVLNGEDALWQQARPLLDAALRLEQHDDTYIWHGWQKSQIRAFLNALPSPCSLVMGVWDTLALADQPVQEKLVLGVVCEVVRGVVCSIRTFESLVAAGLKPIDELEIGMEDALLILRYARRQVAPVAWALFIEKAAWDEWLFASAEDGGALDKGELLGNYADRGRCVLMGSQAASYDHE